jgi:hypothetical protein
MAKTERFDQLERMQYFEYGRTFVFDPINKMFIVGNGDGKNKFLNLYRKDWEGATATHYSDFFKVSEKEVPLGVKERDQEYYIIISGFDIHVMPGLRKYVESLNDQEWREVRNLIEEVMVDVLENSGIKARRDVGGFMGIRVSTMRNGNVGLYTIGNCACLGPEMYRTREDRSSSDFPQVYGEHNWDVPWQGLSLMAGLGTLAWIAETETARDL